MNPPAALIPETGTRYERIGQGFVIVTHDPDLASIGHQVLHIKDGLMQE